MPTNNPLWQPSPERIARANLTAFAARVGATRKLDLPDYSALYAWSIDRRAEFWADIWSEASMIGDPGARTLVEGVRMRDARRFPDARLHYAENLLCRRTRDDAGDALVFWDEDKVKRRVSHAELYASVSRTVRALKAAGVKRGDRVAGYLPNMPETIIATLAASAIGAIWSSASPDFGVQGVVDRFSQIEPTLLFTVDGYWYNGKPQPILDKVTQIVARLPTLRRVGRRAMCLPRSSRSPTFRAPRAARSSNWGCAMSCVVTK